MIQLDAVGVVAGDVTLLRPVSAAVQEGDALVVRGRNGTGKSTLLRLVAGVRTPSTGSVLIKGAAPRARDRVFRRRVTAMIGLPPMAPDLTVLEHVHVVATTWMDDPTAAGRAARAVVAELGLTDLSERFPHELSSGQTQLFGIAVTLARPFEVLILDEPEQRLDPEHVETVIRVLQGRREDGATLVVATHSDIVAHSLTDRAVHLDSAA